MHKILYALLVLGATACTNSREKQNVITPAKANGDGSFSANGITLVPVRNSEKFYNAEVSWSNVQSHIEDDTFEFRFSVKNYALGAQTDDENTGMCSNSDKGQHIHFILDSKPYTALYDTVYKTYLKPGEHILLAFLSRSYHLSLKNEHAFALHHFSSGNLKLMNKPIDMSSPMLFYSRPKGTYTGPKEIERVLLDFYIVNTELKEGGNFVRATIDSASVFELHRWQPYFVNGLGEGTHKIRLELCDADGKLISGPYTSETREIVLQAKNPLE